MIRVVWMALLVVLLAGAAVGGELPQLMSPEGEVVDLSRWLGDKGPTALLVWASWAPPAPEVLQGLEGMSAACRQEGLELLLVDVQEPLEEAAARLEGRKVTWLHDRHGAVLKHFRVIAVPALIIVDRDGSVIARPEGVSAGAIAAWRGQPAR